MTCVFEAWCSVRQAQLFWITLKKHCSKNLKEDFENVSDLNGKNYCCISIIWARTCVSNGRMPHRWMDMNIINLQRLNSKTPRDTAKLPAVARIQCATAGEAGLPVQPVEGPVSPSATSRHTDLSRMSNWWKHRQKRRGGNDVWDFQL